MKETHVNKMVSVDLKGNNNNFDLKSNFFIQRQNNYLDKKSSKFH